MHKHALWRVELQNKKTYAQIMQEQRKLAYVLGDSTYDYRGAYMDNHTPERSEVDNQYHWSSKSTTGNWLKSPNHPTAWKQVFVEKTGINPDTIPDLKQDVADDYMTRNGYKKTSDYLPKKWKPTQLSTQDEQKFREWIQNTEWFKELE